MRLLATSVINIPPVSGFGISTGRSGTEGALSMEEESVHALRIHNHHSDPGSLQGDALVDHVFEAEGSCTVHSRV